MGYWSIDQWRCSIGNVGISGHGGSGSSGSSTKLTPLLYWFQMLFIYMLTLLAISPAVFILWPVIIHNWFPLLRIITGIIVSSGYGYILGIPIELTLQFGASVLLMGILLLFVGIKNGMNCIANSAHDYIKQRGIGCIVSDFACGVFRGFSVVGSASIATIRYAASAYYSAKQMAAPPKQQLKSRSKKETNLKRISTLLLFSLLLFLPSAHAMKTGDIDKEIDEAAEGIGGIESPFKRTKTGNDTNDDDNNSDEVPIDMNVEDKPTDKAILEKLVSDCAGGRLMLIPLEYIRKYEGTNQLMLAMKWGVGQLINIKKNSLSRSDIEEAMKTFDEKIQEAVEALYKSYEKLVNMGDGAIRGASAMALLNYATTKESIRAWLKDPSSRRGKRSLMDPKASECLRMVVQTFARASLNAFRTTYGIEVVDSDLFCTSIILLDMCFIALDNPGNTETGYNNQVEKIAENLHLGECATALKTIVGGHFSPGQAKRMLVFAVSSIKFLFHALHYQAEKGGNHKPLPFIVFSSYPDKYWFKGKLGDVACRLIHKMGTMYHPDFCLRKFGRAMSAEAIKEKNKILYNFYRHVKEVREAMKSAAAGGDKEESIIDDTEPIHQIFERVDTPLTEEERQHERELKKAGSIKGGEASALLLNLGKAIEKNGSVSEDDWKDWDLSDEDWDIINNLVENKYKGKMERLIEVMKNRLNGWTISRGVQELRLAFQSAAAAHELSIPAGDIISDKVFERIGDNNQQLFNKIKDITMVGELECIGKDRLYNMLNGGWAYFLNLPTVLSTFITFAKNKRIESDDVFTELTYKRMGQDLQDIVDSCAGMTLNSTGNEEIGRQLLYEKLAKYHQDRHSSEDAIKKHISKCKGFMKKNCRDGKWYVPKPSGDNQSTKWFISQIRDLEPGDYNYWKAQAFADAGVDLSNWKQSINEDMINERETEARQGLREASARVLGEEEEVVVEEVEADGIEY